MGLLGHYDIGDRPVVTATFADVEGGADEATTVTFIHRDPAGTETSYTASDPEVENPSDNVWVLTVPTLTRRGKHSVRAKSTAVLVAAGEATFSVRRSAFDAP